MIEIFAHRAIYENKNNSLEGIEYCLKSGFNVEIDVRKKDEIFYLSHEPQENGDLFHMACEIIKRNSKETAIHIKENFDITMRCAKTNIAMAFENKRDDVYGFQFHPESFLTTNGKILIKKILQSKRS